MSAMENALTVSQLTRYLKGLFELDEVLSDCWVRGEISNFTHHGSGHMYFTLKDDQSRIKAIMFSRFNRNLAFLPREGMQVLARGYVSIFERDGQYQLYVEEMQPDGIGSLFIAYQQLRDRLEKEGLFRPENKRPLPAFPRAIGVVTSPTGAAIRDIITTLRRRFPLAKVVVAPVLVQGPGAASSIAEAIDFLNSEGEVDVLIVGRGGGSLEELWAFNEEIVARAIHRSAIPVVSAVGHETDTTIADFVADVRAATPTAAAELVTPHRDALWQAVESMEKRMFTAVGERLSASRNRLRQTGENMVFRRPQQMLNQRRQRVDQLAGVMQLALLRHLSARGRHLQAWQERLHTVSPAEKTQRLERRLFSAVDRLQAHLLAEWNRLNHRLERALDKLEALSPLAVLKRGYSLVYRDKGEKQLVRAVSQVELGDLLVVRLAGGRLDCHVWGIEEDREWVPKK
jgi:exodeoxyribonuclease VII large subunit